MIINVKNTHSFNSVHFHINNMIETESLSIICKFILASIFKSTL